MTAVSAPPQPDVTSPLAAQFVGRRYLKLVLVLGALSAIGPLTIDTYLPALPALSAELGASDVQAQTTITGLLVGLGLGQLVIGPLSDAFGRRRPLLLGLTGHALMSLLCALAPSITLLAVTRTLQGISGAAVAVVAMAMIRDLFTGRDAAKLLSRMILVLGVAPILAPSFGSALLEFTSWRGIFVVLAAMAVGLLVLAFVALPETLPPARRMPASVRSSLTAYAGLFRDRTFLVLVAISALLFATLFAYISGSPFILQGLYELSPQQFGLAFSANAVGLILATQLNPLLLRRYRPMTILSVAVAVGLRRQPGPVGHRPHRVRRAARLHGAALDPHLRHRLLVPQRAGGGLEPARQNRRYRGRPPRLGSVRGGRTDRPAGRRARRRHRRTAGRHRRRHHRPGRNVVGHVAAAVGRQLTPRGGRLRPQPRQHPLFAAVVGSSSPATSKTTHRMARWAPPGPPGSSGRREGADGRL